MHIAGKNTILLKNILIGEVWICSGQSNMDFGLHYVVNGRQEVAEADYPQIRLFKLPRITAGKPQSDVDADWMVCAPQSADVFSAVGYFFGRQIHKETGIPIGLIHTARGGTEIESWTPRAALEISPNMASKLADLDIAILNAKKQAKKYAAKLAQVEKARENIIKIEADEKAAVAMANPNLDTDNLREMKLPSQWELAGLPDFDGPVWFKKTVNIPQSWVGRDLMLYIGPIDEIDVTWFNSTKVGSTGSLKENITRFWDVQRQYRIPATAVKAGDNTISVRVIDTAYAGGFWGDKSEQMRIEVIGAKEEKPISLVGAWKYKPVAAFTNDPKMFVSSHSPTSLFNGMINPLVPFAIRGVIWYQGESNIIDGMGYYDKMKALIQSWRQLWDQGDFPFYFVQLAPYSYEKRPVTCLSEIWEAQTASLTIPNTAMVITNDIGNVSDIHPRNKLDVGKRLALCALAKIYGQKDLVYSGPLFKSMAVEDGKIRISFDHVGSGLVSRDGEALSWFEISGEDNKFVKAEAKIDGNTVLVSNSMVKKPVAVRFAWDTTALPNLMNKEGLPASSFRTNR